MVVLDALSAIAAIVTATVAVVGYGLFRWERRSRVRHLEQFLKAWPAGSSPPVLEVMARLKMSEDQVFQAAFASEHVEVQYARSENTPSAALQLAYIA